MLKNLAAQIEPANQCSIVVRVPFPCFFELHAKPGDLIALCEWVLMEPLWMHKISQSCKWDSTGVRVLGYFNPVEVRFASQ
jgi:hypothetical protein